MNKISSFINHHLVLIVSLLIYVCCYVLLNSRGPLVDNDTIEYVKFAKTIDAGLFPSSPHYQPGVGLLIYLFKKVFLTDYLTAFRLLNFTAAFCLVLVLQRLILVTFNINKNAGIIIAGMPVVIYLGSLLYADVVFQLTAFLTILYLIKSLDKFNYFWYASLLTAVSIFIKYNGLALLISALLLYVVIDIRNNRFGLQTIKKVILFSVLPALYLTTWKYYNGKLSYVDFTNYMKPVSLDCIIHYFKHNTLSLYRLIINRFFIGLPSVLNHVILWLFTISAVITCFLHYKVNMKSVIKKIFYSNACVILLIYSFIYLIAVTVMHSLNCVTEPSVRLYSGFFISAGILFICFIYAILMKIFQNVKYVIFVVFLYNATILYRIYHETEGIAIRRDEKPYNNAVQFLKNNIKTHKVFGFATPKINRYWWALGNEFNAMGVFPNQHYHFIGDNFYYTDSDYVDKINSHMKTMESGEYLLVELEESFIKNEVAKIRNLKTVFKQDNIYVFQK
jgi:hypothetical protein